VIACLPGATLAIARREALMRARYFGQAAVTGIVALVLVPGCRADSINIASVSGLCIPSMSVTSAGTPAVAGGEFQTCGPSSPYEDTEMASAEASAGLLQISGYGIVAEGTTSVTALASYSEEIVVTGPESGSGTLLMSFETAFDVSILDGSLSGQLSGGVSFECFTADFPICPVLPTTVELALPFTYGVPFTYTISLSAQGTSGESFRFMDSATLTEMEAGPLDTISSVPEPTNFGLMLVGLTVLALHSKSYCRRCASTIFLRSGRSSFTVFQTISSDTRW
jgi:hypothetical protein